jgi:L-seryl-tRNA(Ser) seleniumtransferase
MGMIKALEIYLKEDHEALNKQWQHRLEFVSAQITKVPGVTTAYNVPDIANHVPHMTITWDQSKVKLDPKDAYKQLREGKPSIVLGGQHGGLGMNSFMLKPGEEKIIAEHLTKLLRANVA